MFRLSGLLFAVLVSGAMAQGGPPPATVRVANVEVRSMATTIVAPGTVVSRDDARIAAEVAGRLIWVADIGREVAAGEVVARVESTILRLRETELEAQSRRETARVEFLERESERLRSLVDQNIGARNQLDQTRSDLDVARGDLAVAEARLAQVRDQLDRTEIRAPFDALVAERLRNPGETVAVGAEVVRVLAPTRLEVIARAPLDYLSYVRAGDDVDISVAGTAMTGRVRTLVTVGDENTHQFEVRIDLPPRALPVGQTVRVTLPASSPRDVLAVPRDAMVLRPEGIAVFVIGEDNLARRVPVSTGLAAGSFIEVLGSDLESGQQVVIRGNERLRDGQAVAIQG